MSQPQRNLPRTILRNLLFMDEPAAALLLALGLGTLCLPLGLWLLTYQLQGKAFERLWALLKQLLWLLPYWFALWCVALNALLRPVIATKAGRLVTAACCAILPLPVPMAMLLAAAVISGTVLIVTTYGQDNTLPPYLGSPLNNLYGWLMCLAMMATFIACFDRTGKFADYMTRSSFGLYIVHYVVIASLGSQLKLFTQLPPVTIYLILTVAVFTLSPLLYEILRRIPGVRWCVFGIKGK